MKTGRYFLLGYGPVDVKAESMMGQPGWSYRCQGANPKAPPIKNWCGPSQEGRFMPMAEVEWAEMLEVMQEPAERYALKGSSARMLQEMKHGRPEEIAVAWARLRQTKVSSMRIQYLTETTEILRRLFEAPECPDKMRRTALALLTSPAGERVGKATKKARKAA